MSTALPNEVVPVEPDAISYTNSHKANRT